MTISTNRINLKKHAEVNKMFHDKIKLVIQKIGSSNKTKVMHKLVQEEVLYIGFGTVDVQKETATRYGVSFLNGSKLSGLMADIKYTVSKAEQDSLGKLVAKIFDLNKEEQRIKTTITDTSDMQMRTLEKEREKTFKELINDIDYFDLVDIYYSLYLDALCEQANKDKGKNKLFEEAHSMFSIIVEKTIEKFKKNEEDDNKRKFEICNDYMFASLFTEATSGSIISNIKRMYSVDQVQFLVDIKPSKFSEFKDMATLLTQAELVNATPNAFLNAAKNVVSEELIGSIDTDLESFISLLVSSKYKSSIFASRMVDDAGQKRLEELLLNYKSKMTIKQ